MCENNKDNGGSDGKPSPLTPLLSQVPKGVSKIFILTPEILQSLGISSHMEGRIASCDTAININTGISTAKATPVVADQESSEKTNRFVQEAAGSAREVRKRKRVSERVTDKESETSNFIEDESSVANDEDKEESICCTPKIKKIRRRSYAPDLRNEGREEASKKNRKKEVNNESDNAVIGVRTSRRVAAPKKFDDYIVTDNFVNKVSMRDDTDFKPVSVKRQSRKSSINSNKTDPTKQSPGNVGENEETPRKTSLNEKIMPEEIAREEVVKSSETVKIIDTTRRNSKTRKSLSSRDISSPVSETQTSIDKTKIVRTYARRNSREQKTMNVGKNNETTTGKGVEPLNHGNSETITSLPTRRFCLPANPDKINVSHVKIVKTYVNTKMRNKMTPESVAAEDKSEAREETVPAVSGQEILTTQTYRNEQRDVDQIDVVKSHEELEANEETLSERTDTSEVVLNTESHSIDIVQPENLVNSREISLDIQSLMNLPQSPDSMEQFDASGSELLSSQHTMEEICISKSGLSKTSRAQEESASKPVPPKPRDKDDPDASKSHLPRSPDEREIGAQNLTRSEDKTEGDDLKQNIPISRGDNEENSVSKVVSPEYSIEEQIGALEPNSSMCRDDNEEASIAEPVLARSLPKKQVGASKLDAPMSRDDKTISFPNKKLRDEKRIGSINLTTLTNLRKKGSSTPKLNTPRSLNKKGFRASKPDPSISRDDNEEANITKQATTRCLTGTEAKPSQPDTPTSLDEKRMSFSNKESRGKRRISAAKPDRQRSSRKIGISASNLDTPRSPDKNEVIVKLSWNTLETPSSPDKNEVTASKTGPPMSPDKNKPAAEKLDTPKSRGENADIASKVDTPRSPDENEVIVSKSETLNFPDEVEVIIRTLETPSSPDNKNDFIVSSLDTPSSPDKIEVIAPTPESPSSPDTNKAIVQELESPQSPDNSELAALKPDTLKSPESKETNFSMADTTSPEKNEVIAAKLDAPSSPDQYEVIVSNLDTPTSPDKNDVITPKPELPSSPDKNDVITPKPELPSSPDKNEIIDSRIDIPRCWDENEFSISKLDAPSSPDKEGGHSFSNLLENEAKNSACIPEIISSNEIPPMSPLGYNIEDIVSMDFSISEVIVETIERDEPLTPLDTPIEVPEVPLSRKRGRPRKQPISLEATMETNRQTEIINPIAGSSLDTPVENTCREKKPVRRSENEIDGKGLSDGSDDESAKDEVVLRRRRGRPPGQMIHSKGKARGRGRGRGRGRVDFEYVPRERSFCDQKPETEKSDAVDEPPEQKVEPPSVDAVECGKCKEKMAKKGWAHHNLMKHNDMGWLSGQEEPDFSNNEKLLRTVLLAVVRKKKRKGCFTCETCGDEKRSANGFISHLQFCGKTEDERTALLMTCPICGNVMMPSSMEMHERFHRQMNKAIEDQKKEPTVTPGSGREKRKAAEKAATRISEFTELVKEDEAPAKKRRLTHHELDRLIERPRDLGNPPNRWRGLWKTELNTKGKATCRQPGCDYVGESIDSMFEHNSKCPCTPRMNYVCKICKFFDETEKEVLKHVMSKHTEGKALLRDSNFEGEDSSSTSDYDSDRSNERPQRSTPVQQKSGNERYQRPRMNVKFLDDEVQIDPKWYMSYPPAIRWTMEFECKNYRLRLFEDLSPNAMRLLNDDKALGYLPELETSMRVKETKKRTDEQSAGWITWQRFEGSVSDGIPTFFTGGPVWAVAWLPIPAPMYDRSVDQYVAVSTHPTTSSVYVVGKSHVGKNLIQIWNLGHLDHCKSAVYAKPKMSYGVAHDKGTIWCLEWCPSGCYEDPSFFNDVSTEKERKGPKRMGLLAAACSDGCVHIFSLPFPKDLHLTTNNESSSNSPPIYETRPVLTLLTSTTMYEKGEQTWQCTKLNWSRELGHDTIIAGFSNGYIAMWDLTSESPLFVTKRGETTLIDAFHHFYAHGHAISYVQLIPYGGRRFFISASYDRLTKVWDLEDTSYPLTTTKRGIAMDGAWLTHWPSYLTAYDDVMLHGHTYLMSLRQASIRTFPLLPTNSTTFSVDVSDYGNSIGHGTLAGEILVMFPHHLWNIRDMERDVPRKRWLASTAEVVDFSATGSEKGKSINSNLKRKVGNDYVYMPETYEECNDRFGITFRDNLNRSKRDGRRNKSRPPCSERLAAVNIEQYPFASVNRVSWNPNGWSYLWLCVGYQNGLVRFLNFNAVALDRELNKLLPSHAEAMLEESRRTIKSKNTSTTFVPSHTSDGQLCS